MTDLAKEVRLLKLYALVTCLWLPVLTFAAFRGPPRPEKVLDVERLNIVSPDGKVALALAGHGLLPGPMMDGKSFPQQVSQERNQFAGIIFFNQSGDEVGGLIVTGQKTDSGYEAVGHLSFDQWKQDQVMALQYRDDGKTRRTGLNIWDRPTDWPITQDLPLLVALRTATGAARDSLQRLAEALGRAGRLGTHRAFIGTENQVVSVRLEDTKGRPRARLYVDASDRARLEFLDEMGKVVHAVP